MQINGQFVSKFSLNSSTLFLIWVGILMTVSVSENFHKGLENIIMNQAEMKTIITDTKIH